MWEKGEQRVGLCYCSSTVAAAAAAAAHITAIPIAPAATLPCPCPCCGGSDVAAQRLRSLLVPHLFEQAPFVLIRLSFTLIWTHLHSPASCLCLYQIYG